MFVNWFLLVHMFCVWYYSMVLWIKTATTITSMLITQSSRSTQRSLGDNSKMGGTQCVKVSVFGVILVRIFPHSDWHSVQMRQNTDQNNSEYGHFSRSEYQKMQKVSHITFKCLNDLGTNVLIQQTFPCSNSKIETLEILVRYVQS